MQVDRTHGPLHASRTLQRRNSQALYRKHEARERVRTASHITQELIPSRVQLLNLRCRQPALDRQCGHFIADGTKRLAHSPQAGNIVRYLEPRNPRRLTLSEDAVLKLNACIGSQYKSSKKRCPILTRQLRCTVQHILHRLGQAVLMLMQRVDVSLRDPYTV